MAVLKRGDKTESPSLDSPRRFARSFVLSWELLCSKSGNLVKLQLCPAAVVGLMGCVWLWLYSNDVFWSDGWYGIMTDTVFGMAALYILSVMRQMQERMVFSTSGTGMETASFHVFVSSLGKAVRTWVPLLCVGAVVCAVRCLLKALGGTAGVALACTGVAAVVSFSVFGMAQSYMETATGPFLKQLRKGLTLNGRYFGSFCILFVLSALMLSLAAAVLYYGSFLLLLLDDNCSNALLMGEELECPWYVSALKYPLFFMATVLVVIMQPVWSLPQQIHIKSVIFKDSNRHKPAKRKSRTDLPEDGKTTLYHE